MEAASRRWREIYAPSLRGRPKYDVHTGQHARVSRERKRKKMQSLEEENVALKARVAELEAALAAR